MPEFFPQHNQNSINLQTPDQHRKGQYHFTGVRNMDELPFQPDTAKCRATAADTGHHAENGVRQGNAGGRKQDGKHYHADYIKKETIKNIVSAYPKLSKGVSKKLLSELYDAAFDDGMDKFQQDILNEYIEKQGCEKCEHYKRSDLFNECYCELDECDFKKKEE